MDNLFDLLEEKIKEEANNDKIEINNIKKEEKLINKPKSNNKAINCLYTQEDIEKSGVEKQDYIRINSFVGSRMNTDFRIKYRLINDEDVCNREENSIDIIKENNEDKKESLTVSEDNIESILDNTVKENKLLVVDGSSLLSTSFYATARDLLFAKTEEQKEIAYTKLMRTKDGVYTNGVYMFFKTLLPLLEKQEITHLAVVLDRSRNTFRREIDKDYKATRKETPHPLKSQFKLLTEVLEDINIKVFSDENYEADDFAGSIAKKFEKDIPTYLHTKDEDYLQLVSDNTKVWMVTTKADDMYKELGVDKKGLNIPSSIFEYIPQYVKHFKGVEPVQIIDIKAIEGDKSDNIKGVKNVGEASSRPLVRYYGSLEKIYENIENLNDKEQKELAKFFKEELQIKRSPIKNLLEYKEDAYTSKILATIKTDIDEINTLDLEELTLNINYTKMNELFKELEMNSLIKK